MCGANPSLPAKCGLPVCSGSGFTAYTAATPCTNDGVKTKGNNAVTLNAGVYFISVNTDPDRWFFDHRLRRDLDIPARFDDRHQGRRYTDDYGTIDGAEHLVAAIGLSIQCRLVPVHGRLRCLINGCNLRREQQHQSHRKHLRADRCSDVPGQSYDQLERRRRLRRIDRRLDLVQRQCHFQQRCPSSITPTLAMYVRMVQ